GRNERNADSSSGTGTWCSFSPGLAPGMTKILSFCATSLPTLLLLGTFKIGSRSAAVGKGPGTEDCCVRRDWEPEDLIACWTLVEDDLPLLAGKKGATLLGFGLFLKFFELEARFP